MVIGVFSQNICNFTRLKGILTDVRIPEEKHKIL